MDVSSVFALHSNTIINPNGRVIAKLLLEAENFLCLWLIVAGVGVVWSTRSYLLLVCQSLSLKKQFWGISEVHTSSFLLA